MPILWTAGHEAETLDEWDGNLVFGGSASVATSLDRAHSGARSLKMTIDTTGVPLSPPRLFMAYYCAFDEARTGMSGSDVPFALGLTHVLHFAAMPQVVAGVSSIDMAFHGPPSLVPDNLADLKAARTAAGSTAQILLTIGGIESNDFFIEAVDNDRAELISDIMAKVATHEYDGVDIDWENWTDDVVAYERITDFHAALGTALHAAGKILISSAWGYYVRPAAAAYWKAELLDTGLLDYQNLLLHGLVQPSITNQMVVHNAPSYSLSDYGTPAYLAAWDIALFQYISIDGWPPDKIIAGLSFGAHFRWGAPGIMTSPSTSVDRGPRFPTDSWSGAGGIEPGAGGGDLYYLEIIDMPEYATSLFRDFAAGQVPFIGHTGATPADDFFISFDDAMSLQNKMRIARNSVVAGMSVWNISMDFNPSGVGLAARHPLGFTVMEGLDQLFTTAVECGAAVFREQELLLGADRYCSAWYWFSEIHEPRVYWTIMDFTSQRVSPPADSPIIIIGVDNDGAGGSLHLHMFYNGDVLGATDVKYQQSVADLPVGQWVHIETFLHQAENDTGVFRLWQDGVQLLNVSGLRTRYSGGNQVWRVANFSSGLDPPIATVYADDAVIASERIFPEARILIDTDTGALLVELGVYLLYAPPEFVPSPSPLPEPDFDAFSSQHIRFEVQAVGMGLPYYVVVGGVREIRDLRSGTAQEFDITDSSSLAKEFVLGLSDPGPVSLEVFYDPVDPGQIILEDLQINGQLANFLVAMPMAYMTFSGNVTTFPWVASADAAVTGSPRIRLSGEIFKTTSTLWAATPSASDVGTSWASWTAANASAVADITLGTIEASPNSTPALHAHWEIGQEHAFSSICEQLVDLPPVLRTSVRLRYKVYLDPAVDYNNVTETGGSGTLAIITFPGLVGGQLWPGRDDFAYPAGNEPVQGDNWSARIRSSGDGRIAPYLYVQNKPADFGWFRLSDHPLRINDLRGSDSIWEEICIMNSPGQANGICILKIDGETIVEVSDLMYRSSGYDDVVSNGIRLEAAVHGTPGNFAAVQFNYWLHTMSISVYEP